MRGATVTPGYGSVMTVFISWSERESKHVALVLKKWLPVVIQSLPTFMSDKDSPAGKRWFVEIGGQLEGSNYGVFCVTPDNQNSPWLNFEAGAISRDTNGSHVTPVAISFDKAEIDGPLKGYESVNLDKEGFMELVESINGSLTTAAPIEAIRTSAERFWPDILGELEDRPRGNKPAPKFDPDDAIREIRDTVRDMSRRQLGTATADANDRHFQGSETNAQGANFLRLLESSQGWTEYLRLARSHEEDPKISTFAVLGAIRTEMSRRSRAGDAEASRAVQIIDDYVRAEKVRHAD